MYFFVKSEVTSDKVDEFTRKVANKEMQTVEGNLSYVTPDGCYGYDIVECRDENECRQKYNTLVQHGLKIIEMKPIAPMGQFIEAWKQKQRPAA